MYRFRLVQDDKSVMARVYPGDMRIVYMENADALSFESQEFRVHPATEQEMRERVLAEYTVDMASVNDLYAYMQRCVHPVREKHRLVYLIDTLVDCAHDTTDPKDPVRLQRNRVHMKMLRMLTNDKPWCYVDVAQNAEYMIEYNDKEITVYKIFNGKLFVLQFKTA